MPTPDTKNNIRPFQSIESALEFMILLEGAIEEASAELNHIVPTSEDKRDNSGLTLALFKLQQLSEHVHKSRRILNDLNLIRSLLMGHDPSASSNHPSFLPAAEPTLPDAAPDPAHFDRPSKSLQES